MEPYRNSGHEPLLDDMLQDPVVQIVMLRDGITTEQIDAVIETAKARLGGIADLVGGDAGTRLAEAG